MENTYCRVNVLRQTDHVSNKMNVIDPLPSNCCCSLCTFKWILLPFTFGKHLLIVNSFLFTFNDSKSFLELYFHEENNIILYKINKEKIMKKFGLL